MPEVKPLPLQGIRVVSFTQAWAGPVCTVMLSDMGAEVIKIEGPSHVDVSRLVTPFAEGNQDTLNRSGMYAVFNRGKKSLLVDLKQAKGIEIVRKLIKISDIVVENYAPRVMDSLGLGYSALKEIRPDIIMVSLSGYGASGPDKDALAWGNCLEAYCSLSAFLGYHGTGPLGVGHSISDHISGTMGTFAALAALHHRDLTGEGQHIDLSEVEALLTCMPEPIMQYTMNGRTVTSKGNKSDTMSPCGCYRCQGEDNWVAITVATDKEWQDLCRVMGKPELVNDERFQDVMRRQENEDKLDEIITRWTNNKTPLDVMVELQRAGIACGPVYSAEGLYKDCHLRERGFFVEINHPEVGKRELPGLFAKLSETPGEIRGYDPLLGEHTDWVLQELLGANTQDS